MKYFGFCPETINTLETSEDLVESINSTLSKINVVEDNDIESLRDIKNELSSIKSKIEDNKDNEWFNFLLRTSAIICGINVLDELNMLYNDICEKIEKYNANINKCECNEKIVNDFTCKCDCDDFVITSQDIKNELCQKILTNKQSDESQTDQLCTIIADFLNTGSPKLKNTKEDKVKLNAAANLLFGFADFTLHR